MHTVVNFKKGAHPWISIPYNGDNFKTACWSGGKQSSTKTTNVSRKKRLVHKDFNSVEGNPAGFHPINNVQIGAIAFTGDPPVIPCIHTVQQGSL